jgi:N-acylneuraminate cytidylyltransferase
MNIIALIPARSGSKRVPSKNIRPLGEHPLLAYTIAQAQQAGIFADIFLSTESEEIAAVARYYGADVPFLRPEAYAGDHSPDIEWITDALTRLRDMGKIYDCFSILRPTSPFRTADTIRRAWEQFQQVQNIDSLRAVEKCAQHPGKMWVLNDDRMTPLLLNPAGVPWHSTPYQSLPEVYVQNASLEIAWTRVVFEDGSIAGTKLTPFITTDIEGFDINTQYDWRIAEQMLADGTAQLADIPLSPYRNE